MNEFYDSLEPEIRDIVKALRNAGINTTCSCGHKMYVEADIIPDGMLQTIHKTVFNYLAETGNRIQYSVVITLEQDIAGLSRCYARIQIGEKQQGQEVKNDVGMAEKVERIK